MPDTNDQDLSEVFASDDLFQIFGDLIAFRPEGWAAASGTGPDATVSPADLHAVEVERVFEPSVRLKQVG